MALEDEAPRLGCGRRIDELWEAIDTAPNDHERHCPDCQQARVALYNLASVTEAMRHQDPHQWQLQPGGRVKDAIMMVARAEIRRGKRIPLRATQAGAITISEQALAALVRFSADTMTGVRARRCSIELPETGSAAHGANDGPDINIRLRVAASASLSIPETIADVRERIMAVVQAQVAINARQIDVLVEDLYDV